jgi:L-alanine-DL-glutamate epimerase-like enolase superfamily enzyme
MSPIPIAGGETLTGVAEWQSFIERKCFDIGQPDASFTGGLLEFLAVAQLFESQGRRIATHAWGAGASLMQNVHCGFAAPNTCMLELAPDYGPLHSLIIGQSIQIENGCVLPPTTPGLGVQLTDEIKYQFPFVPGSGEFNSVPGKVLAEEQASFAAT